ncbi:MAG: MFS transporter [Actinomycetota bacterium]
MVAPSPIALLRANRDFRAIYLAQVVSFAGDWFAFVAVVGLVLDLTGSDLAASLVFVATMLPTFLAGPLAGPAVDRFDRRKLMVAVSVGQAGFALLFLAVSPGRAWLAFVAQASISALGAFFAPASSASVPNVVERHELPTATAMVSATWGAMLAIGAGVGGLFAAAFGREAAFVANALSFVVAAALVASVRRPTRSGPAVTARMRPVRDTAEAMRYAWHNRPVLALLGSKMGFGLAGGLASIVPVLAVRTYSAGDAGIGLLLAGRGLGALVGPLFARRFATGPGPVLTACGVAALVYGGAYLLMPSMPVLGLAFVAIAVAHSGGGTQWTLSTYGLQVATPDSLRGRVLAGDLAMVTLTLSLSSLAAGGLSARFGPETAIRALAAVSVAWGMTYLLLTRRMRLAPPPPEPAPVALDG